MLVVRIVLSLLLPLALWLVYQRPPLELTGNLALFAVALVFLLGMIWHRPLMAAIRGDVFTYVLASAGINALFGFVGLAAVGGTFLLVGNRAKELASVPALAWGGFILIFLLAWALPMLSTRSQGALPDRTSRREFVSPGEDNSGGR
jgi:hypothetical protein